MPRSADLQWCVVNLNDFRVSAFSVGLTLRPRLLTTRSEIPIHKFAHDGHSNKSKNPAHHTTRSKLALSRAVVKFRFALWFARLSVRNRLARSSRVCPQSHAPSQDPGREGSAVQGSAASECVFFNSQRSPINFVIFSSSGAARSAPVENPPSPTRPYRGSKRREAMPSNAE